LGEQIALLKEKNALLEKETTMDALTGLTTRSFFEEQLRHVLGDLHRRQNPLDSERRELMAAVLFMDLDGFKTVNDTHGHPAGDELLCGVAERLLNSARPLDVVSRYGGDEFAVMLSSVRNKEEVVSIVERMEEQLKNPFSLEADRVSLPGASIGIVLVRRDEYQNIDDIIRDADTAMYKAKKKGKGQYIFFQQ